MNNFFSALLGGLGTGLATIIVNYIKTHSKPFLDKQKKKRQDEVGEVIDKKLKPVGDSVQQIVSVVKELRQEVSTLKEEVKTMKSDINVLKKDMNQAKTSFAKLKSSQQMLIKEQLRHACDKCIQKRYRTKEDMQYIDRLHAEYDSLGPNGYTDSLYDEYKKLIVKIEEHK